MYIYKAFIIKEGVLNLYYIKPSAANKTKFGEHAFQSNGIWMREKKKTWWKKKKRKQRKKKILSKSADATVIIS